MSEYEIRQRMKRGLCLRNFSVVLYLPVLFVYAYGEFSESQSHNTEKELRDTLKLVFWGLILLDILASTLIFCFWAARWYKVSRYLVFIYFVDLIGYLVIIIDMSQMGTQQYQYQMYSQYGVLGCKLLILVFAVYCLCKFRDVYTIKYEFFVVK